jgi:hypothetical protein
MSELIMGVSFLTRNLIFLCLSLLLVLPVHAVNLTDFTSEIIVSDEPVRFSFLIENTSGFDKNIELNYSFPSPIAVDYIPKKITGGKTDRVILFILPDENLINSTYTATIKVNDGSKTVQRLLTVKYIEAEKIIEESKEEPSFFPGIGLISLPEINLSDLVINLILLLIVSVLMISFISRLVNFLNSKNMNSEKETELIQEETHFLTPQTSNLTRLKKSVLEEKK